VATEVKSKAGPTSSSQFRTWINGLGGGEADYPLPGYDSAAVRITPGGWMLSCLLAGHLTGTGLVRDTLKGKIDPATYDKHILPLFQSSWGQAVLPWSSVLRPAEVFLAVVLLHSLAWFELRWLNN
jgi:hypothetical protein